MQYIGLFVISVYSIGPERCAQAERNCASSTAEDHTQ